MKRTNSVWLALSLLAGGCATVPTADELFESGDFGAALAAYEAEPSAHAIYNMAMIHLDREWFDPQRAVDLLNRLSAEYPESPYNRIGVLWLSNWRERDRLALEKQERLQEIAALRAEGANLEGEIESHASEIASRETTIRSLNEQIQQLEREIVALTAQLEEREREREELMRIDLDANPLDAAPLDSDVLEPDPAEPAPLDDDDPSR